MPTWLTILFTALSVLASKALSFRVGSFVISAADVSGTPVHMTFAEIQTAIVAALAGKTGTIQSGDIVITIAPYVQSAARRP